MNSQAILSRKLFRTNSYCIGSEDTGVLHFQKRDFRIIPFIRLRGSSLLQTQYLRRTGQSMNGLFLCLLFSVLKVL
jgi:hypothetical protein